MCGISGVYALEGSLNRTIVVSMHNMLTHRGPDETFSFDAANLSAKLGRLGMNGLQNGWQPANDSSERYTVLTNGEIYNSQELVSSLNLAIPSNNEVDVAIIPELISHYGLEGLEKIDGQFASVIFDHVEKRLILARDRFGICPLYYTLIDGKVYFCSEIKPLVHCVQNSWKIDYTAVDQYFHLGNIVSPRTLVSEIKSIEPGCAMVFDQKKSKVVRYWRYGEFKASESGISTLMLHDAIKSSISKRFKSDVEIGAYLSGGFDSSAIVMDSTELSNHPIRTYSISFNDPSLDESKYQDIVSEAANSNHQKIICSREDIGEKFESMVRGCCFPQRETYNVSALMLSEAVRKSGIKGVLSGEGADELFFGYDSYVFDSLGKNNIAEEVNESAWGRADFSWEVDSVKARERKDLFLTKEAQEKIIGNEYWRSRLIPFSKSELKGLSKMQLRSIADVYVQMSGHLLGDHGDSMVMANSIEGRYPFLGNSVVEVALKISDQDKVKNFEGKVCLREAYDGIVPKSVINRAKQGFTAYDLASVVSPEKWKKWQSLVNSSGIFNSFFMNEQLTTYREEKWDFRLAAISLAIIIDELSLNT